MNEFTRACAQRDIVIPGRDPLDKNAPCPRLYTFFRVLNDFPLFLAFAFKDLVTAADNGLALRRGATFLLVVRLRAGLFLFLCTAMFKSLDPLFRREPLQALILNFL